jgi:hypothetical protein
MAGLNQFLFFNALLIGAIGFALYLKPSVLIPYVHPEPKDIGREAYAVLHVSSSL